MSAPHVVGSNALINVASTVLTRVNGLATPRVYSPQHVGLVIETALTTPADLGLPFGSWTLDRMVVYLTETKGIPIKRSRLSEIFRHEGLRWRHQEGWFGMRVDPDVAE